ncbi:MAG: hypothetical protein QOG80_2874 [Pseudonocardiales bacterium]|jgi:hypothetical protein|nr:hypothetical protein [Pseudonocardiales bacterium]
MTQWGLDALFNPAKRHMDEEKRRLQSTREEIGDSSGGKRIDLESGKVVIERAAEEPEEPDAPAVAAKSEKKNKKAAHADKPESAARARARARRSRS